MNRRTMSAVLGAMMTMLLMLSVGPADRQISLVAVAGLDSVNQSGSVDTATHHKYSAQRPCTGQDCAPESDCPKNMSIFDCGMSGVSCSLCGTNAFAHRMGEVSVQPGMAMPIQDPPNLILTTRSTRIFHPPRLAS